LNEYWNKIKQRYNNGESLANHNTEDMVGRRIIKAMGITQIRLPYLEKELFGEVYTEPLWCRARRFLYEVSRDTSLIKIKSVDVLEDFANLKRTEERILENPKISPIYFVRVKNTKVVFAMFALEKNLVTSELILPFTVLHEKEGYWLCRQKILLFLQKQLSI